MFGSVTYHGLLAHLDGAATNNEKGDRLEDVCEYLFGNVDGVLIEYRDKQLSAEELDLVLWNAGINEVFKALDFTILVECKNWSVPVGAPSLDSFVSKLRRRNLKVGIFIAAHGVTGDFLNGQDGNGAVYIIKSALQDGIRVIVLNRPDLNMITSLEDFTVLIRKRLTGLFVNHILNV